MVPCVALGFFNIQMILKINETKASLLLSKTPRAGFPQTAWMETVKASRSIFVVYGVFVVCWGPFAILLLVSLIKPITYEVHMWVTWVAHLHRAVNFLIYLVTFEHFRKGTRALIGRAFESLSFHRSNSVVPEDSKGKTTDVINFQVAPSTRVIQVTPRSSLEARDPIVCD